MGRRRSPQPKKGIKFTKHGKAYYRQPNYGKGASVYFICCQSPDKQIKIGVSRNPLARLENLSTANPYQLTLLYEARFKCEADAYKAEEMLHNKFKANNVKGEWFAGLNMDYAIMLVEKAASEVAKREEVIAETLDLELLASNYELP